MQCDTTNINPDNIAGSSITDEGFENESGGRSADGRRRRRRRRSVPKGERMIVKRQDGEDNSGDDRTLVSREGRKEGGKDRQHNIYIGEMLNTIQSCSCARVQS